MRMKFFIFFFFFCLFIAFFSCSKTEPRILYGFMDLTYYQSKDKPLELCSFFVLCEDDDGIENLSELYLYHDRDGLRWMIDSDDWVKHEENGKIWVGSRSITMVEDIPMPRGVYRAVLINKGGEKTERNFTFDGPVESPYPFPNFSISGGSYHFDSKYPVNYLICYDQQGKPIQTILLSSDDGNIRDLRLSGNVRTAALWANDTEYHISALTESAAVR